MGVERIQRIARNNIIFGGETVVSPSRKVTLADEMQVTGVESEYVSGRLGSSTNPHLDL